MVEKLNLTMKRLTFLFALLVSILTIQAQGYVTPLNEEGVYEIKKVVVVDGVSANELYLRALEVLSDWNGSNFKSKSQIDVQDKDAGLVVYKGKIYNGFRLYNKLIKYGWDAFSDFTLRIKCKDEKCQLTLTVPSMTFLFNGDASTETVPIDKLIPYNYKPIYNIKKVALEYTPKVYKDMTETMDMLTEKMKTKPDDDF